MRMISFRTALVLSIIIAVLIISVATYYARQLSTTTTITIAPQKDFERSTRTTRIESLTSNATVSITEIDNWSIIVRLYVNGTGVLRVQYVGEKPLIVENPLLPLTAGLSVTLEYSDSSKNTVIKSLGSYYYNASITIEHGNYSDMKFDAKGLVSIRVEGKILGKIPVRIHIPLTSAMTSNYNCTSTSIVTVTVTKTTCYQTTSTSISETSCKLVHAGKYLQVEPSTIIRRVEGNQTIVSDSIIEVHIPLEVDTDSLRLIIMDKSEVPVIVNKWYFVYEIVNVSFDGVHYERVNKKMSFAIPTTTIPPWITDCIRLKPGLRIFNKNDIIMPGGNASFTLTIPRDVLDSHSEAWMYIALNLEYWPVQELYNISINNTIWKHVIATKIPEKTYTMYLIFKIHWVSKD